LALRSLWVFWWQADSDFKTGRAEMERFRVKGKIYRGNILLPILKKQESVFGCTRDQKAYNRGTI